MHICKYYETLSLSSFLVCFTLLNCLLKIREFCYVSLVNVQVYFLNVQLENYSKQFPGGKKEN